MANRRNSFLYEHNGMLQSDRLKMTPTSCAMRASGRSFEDLVKRSAEFARTLVYYNDDNRPDGDWTAFFREIYDYESRTVRTEVIDEMIRTSSVRPHLALMFAFFRMLLVGQEDFNAITDRQMEFYFHDVLGFDMRGGTEGVVTVFAELAANTDSVSIPKGLRFDAGKDDSGETIVYESVDELRLGRDEVSHVVRYCDESGFAGVGRNDLGSMHSICISSRLFGLRAEALRIVVADEVTSDLLSGLEVEYTSGEGWTLAGTYCRDGIDIGAGMPPMIPYDPELHGRGLNTEYPAIRFVSRNGMGRLSEISPAGMAVITVHAQRCEPLRLENKYGQVENRAGVNPFGYESRRGDFFRVVLPFPTDSASVSVEMSEESVFQPDDGRREDDKVYYSINCDDCNQEHVSREYSRKLLHIMKRQTYDENELNEALKDSEIMARQPRLLSSVTISYARFDDCAAAVSLVHPCGVMDVSGQTSVGDSISVGADMSALYLALSNVNLDRGQISLHVTTSGKVIDPGRVTWEYLSRSGWTRFAESRIIRDTTAGMSQDGTVILDCREKLPDVGPGFMDGFTWIRAVCDCVNCMEVCDVRSRAIELAYSPSSRGKGPGGDALPKDSISKPMTSVVGLKKVIQPSDGLKGSRKESHDTYRRRVAETLRHKGRAWSVWDYESIILERFREVAYAKCLPSCDQYGNVSPGTVTIVVIPAQSVGSLRPSAGVRLINDVRSAIGEVSTSFVNLNVVNPVYREIKVDACITLRQNFNDSVRYETEVSDALVDYLRSWKGYADGSHFSEGQGVSDIIAFLESLPYVDVVDDITVYLDDNSVSMDGGIDLYSPLEALTSSSSHAIHCKTAD